MDVERKDNFCPVTNLNEDVEKIVLMKAALIAITDEHERNFLVVQDRLKAGKRQLDICTQESSSLDLKINAVETKISEALSLNQTAERETLNAIRENLALKRKIISLKHDMEKREKLLLKANETISAAKNRRTNKD